MHGNQNERRANDRAAVCPAQAGGAAAFKGPAGDADRGDDGTELARGEGGLGPL